MILHSSGDALTCARGLLAVQGSLFWRDWEKRPLCPWDFGVLWSLADVTTPFLSFSSRTDNAEYNKFEGPPLLLRPDELIAPQPGQHSWVPGGCDLEHPLLVLPWH